MKAGCSSLAIASMTKTSSPGLSRSVGRASTLSRHFGMTSGNSSSPGGRCEAVAPWNRESL